MKSMAGRVIIFGGTTEGRKLSMALERAGIDTTLSVATVFGRDAARDGGDVFSGRLDEEGMTGLLKKSAFSHVLDATHPYAVLATKNIRAACEAAGLEYYRLKRPESETVSGVVYVPDTAGAAEILKGNDERVLLAVGSKELEPFTHVQNYAERFFVRILPMQDSLEKVSGLGFRGSNVICMQGPFDYDMNVATLKMTGAASLVTKESGDAGGFHAKVSAAFSLGCEVIVVGRPSQEEGYTLDEILGIFGIKEILEHVEIPDEITKQKVFFPLFFDIIDKKIMVIGGGNVAGRRIKTLADFGAEITVISPKSTEYIKLAASQGTLRLLERKYQKGDILDIKPFFLITATDDRQTNRDAAMEAAALGIPVSVADCREECTCWFPAIAESENFIAGIASKDGDHLGVKRMAERIRRLLNT